MVRTAPKLVTVFGGSGFVGTHLVQLLARGGYRIRVAVRRPDLAGTVRMFGGVGQVVPVQANLRNAESVARAVAGADIVINLVGIGYERGKQRFQTVHAEGAALVAQAAKAAGAERLVHLSALGVDRAAEVSTYAASKLAGETAVLDAFPDAVIVRPSIIFGQDDSFFNLIGSLARLVPALPLVSPDTQFQPVFVGDVAEALFKAAQGEVKGGRAYELGGPDVESYKALLERALREAGRNRALIPVPAGLLKIAANLIGILPFKPVITADQIELLSVDNVVSAEAVKDKRSLAAFDITPTSMDQILPQFMWRFRRHGQFDRDDSATDTGVAV